MSNNSAIINEYKGNLFEFLVASHFAQEAGIYEHFYSIIPPVFLSSLKDYQTKLYEYEPELYKQLPIWAKNVAEKMKESISGPVTDVQLVGKIAGGSHDERFSESDIIISTKDKNFISLKLSRSHSYVNTKSAGIKSFFEKYFTYFNNKEDIQTSLNEKHNYLFEVFSRELHDIAGIDYTSDFKNWLDAGLPDQPGKLAEEFRGPLMKYYNDSVALIYEQIKNFPAGSFDEYKKSIKSLMGHSQSDVSQVIAFHNKNELVDIKIINDINLDDIDFVLPEDSRGYFYIESPAFSLQIRVKPMMTFTQAALKVNCSVKYFD